MFKFKITLDRHNVRPKVNYWLHSDPPHFSLQSTFKEFQPFLSATVRQLVCIGSHYGTSSALPFLVGWFCHSKLRFIKSLLGGLQDFEL
jgi:hypothetical protein